jgi:regulator of RNase E activity RraA
MPIIPLATLSILRKQQTTTICDALELVTGGSAEGFSKTPVVCADASLPPIVGFARTAKIRASSPAHKTADEVRALRMQYYDYVSAGPGPNLVVVEDTDWPNCIGGFWDEMQVAQHKGLALVGTLTNGVLRDVGKLDPGYQVIAGSIGPSHAYAHVTEVHVPVTVFGMAVRPGDLIHADHNGAVVIPGSAVDKLPAAIDLVLRRKQAILQAARAPGFTVAKLKAAWLEADQTK